MPRYGFDASIADSTKDVRPVAGRILLLPQAATILGTTLEHVFLNTNKTDLETKYGLTKANQTELLADVGKLQFISAPLAGLTSHLLTLLQGGAHVKPTIRHANARPIVIDAAAAASADIGIDATMIQLMESETTLLPYGTSVMLDSTYPARKMVTHGRK